MNKLKTWARSWLELNEPVPKLDDDLRKLVDKLQRELDFWKKQFSKNAATKKCTVCRRPISLWPFETEGYYIKGNRVTHIECNK